MKRNPAVQAIALAAPSAAAADRERLQILLEFGFNDGADTIDSERLATALREANNMNNQMTPQQRDATHAFLTALRLSELALRHRDLITDETNTQMPDFWSWARDHNRKLRAGSTFRLLELKADPGIGHWFTRRPGEPPTFCLDLIVSLGTGLASQLGQPGLWTHETLFSPDVAPPKIDIAYSNP